ncbi:hypothetical protein GGQ19_002547 [Salinibacter ruber]|uniref:hypothetical protein n=1 Tax=Salinibacter ruber TaxID=146919 RepID=UPI00216A6833|nr:hypothetical protein [Salinibacter ruber]MCS3751352.1 hypothetical protein [Salinibacter ruber]
MSTYPERFLERLEGLKLLPKSGQYQVRWEARCPAHNDRIPSLSISLAPEGHLLVHCHAGCPTEAVMSAVGLEMSDLYPPSASPSKKKAPKKHSPNPESAKPEPAKSESAQSPPSNQNPGSKTKTGRFGEITGTYDYYDAEGTLLYQVVRFVPKKFRQRRPNPKGGWIWSLKGVGRVLYLLPEMLEAIGEGHPILIVEGEKDVETALRMRSELDASSGRFFSATTAPGGAGKWRSSFSRFFKGAHVWIVPDIDEAGFDHARQVAKRLRGVAESIKVLRLPSTTRHFDLSDWAAQGKTGTDLLHLSDQSPYLLSRAHPTHEVAFEAVPGPSAPMEEIQEYLVSVGSVRSGNVPGDPSKEETPPEEVATEDASSGEDAHISPPDQQDEQPTSTGKPSKWEGIGVTFSEGQRPTEVILSGLDQVVSKNRNGEVGFCLPPTDPEGSDSDVSTSGVSPSENSTPKDFTSASDPDDRTIHSEGKAPTEEPDLSAEAGPSEETSSPVGTDPLESGDSISSKPSGPGTESITEADEISTSRKNGSQENGSSDNGPSENGSVAVHSRQNRTSHSSNADLSESRQSAETSFSSETRRVIRLFQEEGAEVISAGGAFYLVFPFPSSPESSSQKQAEEGQRPAVSGKAYLLESPLAIPLLLRLAYDRKGWIPSPDACRAALLFLTPAVPLPAHVSSRVAAGNGALYIDAGENTILEVKPGEWNARSSAPAIFLRSEYACPLPAPKKRGSLAPLRRLLRIEADEAWIGIRGWLLGTLCPTGPVPPLLLGGDDPRRLSRLAGQLASLLDPRSISPGNPLRPLLSTRPGATADPRIGDLRQNIPFQETLFYEEPSQKASPVPPFVCCLPDRFLRESPALPPGSENGGEHPQPLGTRLIFVGSERGLRPELREGLLAVRPTFRDELRPPDVSKPTTASTGGEGPSERDARAEALGVLLQGTAEAMEGAGEIPLPEDLGDGPHRDFLAWVAAAEAGLSPASLGSELSGPSSRPFVEVWRKGRRRPGLLRRLVQALLRGVGWDSIGRTRP